MNRVEGLFWSGSRRALERVLYHGTITAGQTYRGQCDHHARCSRVSVPSLTLAGVTDQARPWVMVL